MVEFSEALASKKVDAYSAWFSDEMKLYTPLHEEPIAGKPAACQILSLVFSFFDDFHYVDVFTGTSSHALVFRATLRGTPLEGVDYVRTDDRGQVTDFHVMVRPLEAINALSAAIGEAMGSAPKPQQ